MSLHLLALVLRAIAWGLCLDAAGSRVPPRELHATSGPRFLADTVVPTYVGAWVRIGLLKMMMGPRAPTIGQMISADGVILLVEGGITVVVVVALTFGVGLPWWWSATVIGLAGAGALVALWLKQRYADRPFVRTFNVLAKRHTLFAAHGTPGGRPGGSAHSLLDRDQRRRDRLRLRRGRARFPRHQRDRRACPSGPGPASVGATGVVFSGEELGLIAASGIGLTATAFVAALIYSLAGLAIAGPGARASLLDRAEPRDPVGTRGHGTPR